MKMQKYTAPDMRTALRKVRAEHGSDVVILSTRRAGGVVELTVASDAEAVAAASAAATTARMAVGDTVGMVTKPPAVPRIAAPPAGGATDAAEPADSDGSPSRGSCVVPIASTGVDAELRALRRLLETQLAALAWNNLTRRSPVAAELLRRFAELGIDRELAASLVAAVEPEAGFDRARDQAFERLRARLGTTGDVWSEQGGTMVMVGPAGSGKTSALAAIAARWVMRHGPSGSALVSAGDPRTGAYEHLARLGRLFGLPTYRVAELQELPGLLARLRDHRLVLVDTAALSTRDDHQADAIAALRGTATITLTLPATSQAAMLRDAARRYAGFGASACIATRLDEAASLGGLLSAVIAAGLPLAYLTDGIRLPEDLRPADATEIVALASTLAERHGAVADEEMLVRRLGGSIHASP